MSKNPKPVDENLLEIDEENESFHSFAESKSELDGLENLSNISEDFTLTDECEFELELANILKKKPFPLDGANSSSSSDSELERKFHIPKFGIYPTPKQIKHPTPLRKSKGNHHLVPELRCDSPMPGMELFEMNELVAKKETKENRAMEEDQKESDALQKFAFTEIWVERQLNESDRKRKFTTALDDYFLKENTDALQKLTLEEQQKGAINKQLFVEPAQSSSVNSQHFQSLTAFDSPVKPFKAFSDIQAVEKKLPGQKSYITVPAGYDLTNLVQYKDPNHWHRRGTTRNDSRP